MNLMALLSGALLVVGVVSSVLFVAGVGWWWWDCFKEGVGYTSFGSRITRKEDPFNYWFFIVTTAAAIVVMAVIPFLFIVLEDVRMHVAAHVLFGRVVDRLVRRVLVTDAVITAVFVGHEVTCGVGHELLEHVRGSGHAVRRAMRPPRFNAPRTITLRSRQSYPLALPPMSVAGG